MSGGRANERESVFAPKKQIAIGIGKGDRLCRNVWDESFMHCDLLGSTFGALQCTWTCTFYVTYGNRRVISSHNINTSNIMTEQLKEHESWRPFS
ncbi:unnamed protein product [Leptosia nina]|uniref:Uncharacterized protein n=1 Tax=Leptosia nina TaxID=320188 RepID=A0AAV1JJM8_9NEOP